MCQLIGNEPPAPQVEPQGQCHREGGGGALTPPIKQVIGNEEMSANEGYIPRTEELF